MPRTDANVTIAQNPHATAREWWGRAAEDRNAPVTFDRLAVSGMVTLAPSAATALWAWAKTLPGWSEIPLIMMKGD